jgi:hypothetical protein
MRLECLCLFRVEGFEIAVVGVRLEAIEGLRHAVQGCLGMAFRFLQVSKVLVLDADIVGVVGFHGLLSPIKSEQSGSCRCTRLKPGLGRHVAGHFLEGLERVARRGTAPVNLERLKRRR